MAMLWKTTFWKLLESCWENRRGGMDWGKPNRSKFLQHHSAWWEAVGECDITSRRSLKVIHWGRYALIIICCPPNITYISNVTQSLMGRPLWAEASAVGSNNKERTQKTVANRMPANIPLNSKKCFVWLSFYFKNGLGLDHSRKTL